MCLPTTCRLCHGQGNEFVGITFSSSESTQLFLHGLQGRVVLIGGVGATHIHNGVVRTKTCQGVDVRVGVVAS